MPAEALTLLVVDDEAPARSELAYLLDRDPRVRLVHTAAGAAEALRVLQDGEVDGIFLDIRMPGLSGVDLARVLSNFRTPPPVVFVTAYDEHALEAFEVNAVDYLLKPIRPDRLAEAVRRIATDPPAATPAGAESDGLPETIPVELAGVTRFVPLAEVRYVEAHGDYARLHTASGSHLVRVPMATLEDRWAEAGFVRIHRSYLVALAHVTEVNLAAGRAGVRIGSEELPVSRRHVRELRDVLVRRSRPGADREQGRGRRP